MNKRIACAALAAVTALGAASLLAPPAHADVSHCQNEGCSGYTCAGYTGLTCTLSITVGDCTTARCKIGT